MSDLNWSATALEQYRCKLRQRSDGLELPVALKHATLSVGKLSLLSVPPVAWGRAWGGREARQGKARQGALPLDPAGDKSPDPISCFIRRRRCCRVL